VIQVFFPFSSFMSLGQPHTIVSMRVLIYGGGAVGLGLASCLLKAGARVDILTAGETVSALREHGLVRDGIFGEYRAGPESFTARTLFEPEQTDRYDYVLVCTKSMDTKAAAEDLARWRPVLGERVVIVLCQNGWGNAEHFLLWFPRERVYNARVITGFCRPQPHRVTVTVHADAIHVGSLYVGDLAPVAELCRLITAGDIPCQPTEAIEKDLWAKMLYNCALNPLGAVLGVPYGELAAREDGRAVMDSVVREVYAVMDACGYRTHWDSADAFLDVFYGKLVPPTAAHESSMLQDVREGRTTEIAALNGQVVDLGERHLVSVPCNRMLCHLMHFLEKKASG